MSLNYAVTCYKTFSTLNWTDKNDQKGETTVRSNLTKIIKDTESRDFRPLDLLSPLKSQDDIKGVTVL